MRVPLQSSSEGYKFRNNITGHLTFKTKREGCKPPIYKLCKYSAGKCTISESPSLVSVLST